MSSSKRNRSLRFAAILATASFTLLTGAADATVLTFDQGNVTNHGDINQTYGDDVEAILEGTLSYGVGAEGFTPNVQLTYGDSDPALWITGYGDLTNILFEDADNTGVLTVTLTADTGFQVLLHEFDAASFIGGDPAINSVRISNGVTTLFEELNGSISSSTHTTFDFTSAPLTASQLIIEIDALNLGFQNDDIGIDNLRFSQQPVPEPTAFVLALLGLLGGVKCLRGSARGNQRPRIFPSMIASNT